MKVVVIGANGQLGSDCCTAFREAGHEVIPLTHSQVEVSDAESVSSRLRRIQPEAVVNTAAMTNVPACETAPERAFAANGIGARNLAISASELDFLLIHVSTDYVFDGAKGAPYVEEDLPRPLNVYGNTKLSGEHFVQAIARRYFVVRSSGLYGKSPCRGKGGLNFVGLMLKLARERGEVTVVADQIVTPTYTLHLARQMAALTVHDCYGIVHATCQGQCSWYEFAQAIFELTGVPVRPHPAASSESLTDVTRPSYSVLENQRLQAYGLDIMPHWKESLESYLHEIREVGACHL